LIKTPTTAYEKESITISDTAIGFSEENINPSGNNGFKTLEVQFVVENGPIRVCLDGTDPTAITGFPCSIGDFVTIKDEHDIKQFKAIKASPSDAKIQPIYFRGW
jgi:hypothetical protein